MGYIDSAVKRGLEHPATAQLYKRFSENPKQPDVQIPAWGVAVLVVTFVVFVVSMSAIEYTLKDVIATLAMIETPSAAITVTPSEESAPKNDKEGALEAGPQITHVYQKPITSTIRGTTRHLVSQAGRFSRWRGIRSLALYSICFSMVANILDAVVPMIPGRLVLITGTSGALLANLHAAWTHKVISMPSEQGLWARVPCRKQWKVLALPAAVEASAKYVSIYIAQGFVAVFGLTTFTKDNVDTYKGHEWALFGAKLLGVFLIVLACGLFIVLPALVTLIRVEASLLPDEQDTIVPFDRTFAGKVVPTILGGTGSIGFLDAWKSFNWEARRRLIKLYIKTFAIIIALSVAFSHVFMLEIWAIMGNQLGEALANARRNGFNQL